MLNFQEGRRERKNINQALTSSTLEEWEKERSVTNTHTHTHTHTHTRVLTQTHTHTHTQGKVRKLIEKSRQHDNAKP